MTDAGDSDTARARAEAAVSDDMDHIEKEIDDGGGCAEVWAALSDARDEQRE